MMNFLISLFALFNWFAIFLMNFGSFHLAEHRLQLWGVSTTLTLCLIAWKLQEVVWFKNLIDSCRIPLLNNSTVFYINMLYYELVNDYWIYTGLYCHFMLHAKLKTHIYTTPAIIREVLCRKIFVHEKFSGWF